MKSIQIELPTELSTELERLGLVEGSGIAEWVTDAIQQKLAAAKQFQYLESRALRGSREMFLETLSKIPAIEPAEEDRW